jgi:hypothetical protein
MFFSLNLLCKKDIFNINHCEGTVKKIQFFFLVGHGTSSALNPVLHLICCTCLMLVMKIYAATMEALKGEKKKGETQFTTKIEIPPPLNANVFFFWVGFHVFEFHLIYLGSTLLHSISDDEFFLKKDIYVTLVHILKRETCIDCL